MWSLYWSVLWFCWWSPLIIKKETPSQMIPCQFCKIFKNTFFIEHLRWLLLAILKPLDSQRQLCKWISKLVTIYLISTFCWRFCVYFWRGCLRAFLARTSFLFTSRRPFGWGYMTVLIFYVTTQLKCHVTFWVGPPRPESTPYQFWGQ